MPEPTTPPPAPPPQDVDWQPGKAGSVTFDRVRLDIAADSFAERVSLRLQVPDTVPDIPEHLKLPFVFRVEARNARGELVRRLGRAIRFSIDFADLRPFAWGNTFVNLYYYDEATRRWTVILANTDMAARRIEAEVEHFTDFGFGGDNNQQPSTPSNLEGFQVDLCTGSASATIELKVPPGTAGLTPKLQLQYSSGSIDKMNEHWIRDGNNTGNENTRTRLQASPVGFGWSLELGAIVRFNPLSEGGHFRFFLIQNGKTTALAYVDGTQYRTEPEEYLRVRKLTGAPNDSSYHEYWLIEAKDGTQYRFGYVPNSELRAGKWNFGGTQIAWQWNLDQIKDPHGNTIDIEYTEVSANPYNDPNETYDQAAYPYKIRYTGNPGQNFTANREITFVYSDRTDHATHAGYTYTQYYLKKKLDRIEMRVAGSLVRSYEFSYSYAVPYWHPMDSLTQTAGLAKLVLTGLVEKDGSGNALPAMSFTNPDGSQSIPGTSERYKLQLTAAANGYGGKVLYSYEGHTPDGWQSLMRRYRVKEQRVESGVGTGSGVNSDVVRTYSYGPSYNVSADWDYRGHGEVTVTDTAGHAEKTYFYTRDSVNGMPGYMTWIFQSRAWKRERYKAGQPTPVWYEQLYWGFRDTNSDAKFVFLSELMEYQGSVSRKHIYDYDDYGNRSRSREYGSASAAGGDWLRNTRRSYNSTVNSSHYVVGKLAAENVYKPGSGEDGEWVSSTWYCYDGSYRWDSAVGSGQYGDDGSYRGRLTAVRRSLDGANSVDTSYAYDFYGNRLSATEYGVYGLLGGQIATSDPRATSVQYESTYHSFPSQITNPLGQVETRSYDARWGKPTQIADPNGGVSDLTYDTYGRLTKVEGPQVSGPGGAYRRTASYAYHSPATASGRTTTQLLIQRRTDLGGASPVWLTTRRFYDGIGRVIQEYADGYSGVNVVNSYYDGRGLKAKESVAHAGTGTGLFLDGDWANYSGAATSFGYDELRRPTTTTLPDGQTKTTRYSDWSATAIDQKGHARRFDKDALGRVIAVVEYSGVDPSLTQYALTSYQYDLLDRLTLVTDNAGNQTVVSYDPLGRKTDLIDPDMGAWHYEYDPVGTLKSQRDAKGQTIYFYYDVLKRLVRKWYAMAWTEEAVTATSKPSIYDLMELRSVLDTNRKAAGLGAMSWTDPAIVAGNGVKVRAVHFTELKSALQGLWTAAGMGTIPEFTGGAIVAGTRRIMATDLTDLRGWLGQYENSNYGQTKRARAYYEYDAYDGTSQFGRGKRTGMWDGCGRQSVWYDKAGRTTKEERTIDGALYTTQWAYDALDRVYQLTYQDGEVLTYSYGANGLLSSLASSLGSTLIASVEYNALNLLKKAVLGSGITAELRHTYYGLDVSGSPYGAQKTIQLQQGTSPMLVNRDIGYDYAGNITSIDDLVNSENIAYTYDDLDRLLSAGSPLNESYAYNQIGNITSKNGLAYTYDATHKHAVASYDGTTYGYDANGSMATRGSQSIKYDPENRPARVSVGSTICRFAYDGDNVRRKRLDSNGTIHYLGSYERNVGNGLDTTEVVTKYYHALGRLLAFRKAGTLYWVGTDHLGGTIRVADGSFSAVDGMRYRPFGESRDAGTNLKTDHRFTSQIEGRVGRNVLVQEQGLRPRHRAVRGAGYDRAGGSEPAGAESVHVRL